MKFVNMQKIINFIYPPKCYICNSDTMDQGICQGCFVNFNQPLKYCYKCGFILDNNSKYDVCISCSYKKYPFDELHYSYIYNDHIFNIINKFKSQDEIFLSKIIANMLSKAYEKCHYKYDLIIPTPVHNYTLFKRKYNHMALVAKDLSNKINLSYDLFSILKKKNTREQKSLSGKQRLQNVKNSFIVTDKGINKIKNKSILLIDDIITTGATINECSAVLKNSGAKSIGVLSFSRVEGVLKI